MDYEKTFDTVSYNVVFNALQIQGVLEAYVGMLAAIYRTATGTVKLFSDTDRFNIGQGVRQGFLPNYSMRCLRLSVTWNVGKSCAQHQRSTLELPSVRRRHSANSSKSG